MFYISNIDYLIFQRKSTVNWSVQCTVYSVHSSLFHVRTGQKFNLSLQAMHAQYKYRQYKANRDSTTNELCVREIRKSAKLFFNYLF